MKVIIISALVWLAGSLVLLLLLLMLFAGIFDTSLMTQIDNLDENLGDRYIYEFLFFALIGTTIQSIFIKAKYFGSLAVASFLVGLITSILVSLALPWFESLVLDYQTPKSIVDWDGIFTVTPFLFIFCSIIAGVCFAVTQNRETKT